MANKKPRIKINGVEYVECCVDCCGELVAFRKVLINHSYRCRSCAAEYRKKWDEKQQNNGKRKKITPERLHRQLEGEEYFPNKFEGCSPEVIELMKAAENSEYGNVEALLKMEVRK